MSTIEIPQSKLETNCCSPETMEYTPPTKRPKTLSSVSPSKGKSIKIEKEEDLDSCGVCLLEEGMALRGLIDSCHHYFCFVCIMEWAKVESRCPICKRRFSTIQRPPKDGVFSNHRVINVPVRDQVYYHTGNATIGPSDPYSETKCNVCSLSTDENLLLLCDLCDSAAHSYCVGLGATVPEGDWFCHDCNLSRDEHDKAEPDASPRNTIRFAKPEQVSINDIIRDSSSSTPISTTCHQRESSSTSHQRESSSIPVGPTSNQRESSNIPVGPTSNQSELGSNARTLKRCLAVHARIKVLRENWEGFREGSLNFSSSFGDGVKKSQPQTSSSNQQSTSENHPNANNLGSYNIDKAWKMMDIAAKALGRKCGNKISKDKVLKQPVKKEILRPNSRYFGELKNNETFGTSRNNGDKHKFQILEKKQNHIERELPSFRKFIKSSHMETLKKDNLGATSNVVGSMDHLSHRVRSPFMATEKSCVKKGIDDDDKKGITKDLQLDSKIKKVEDAKSEIQALVKLNLKILSKDKKLEVHVFKEVARHATHSILGACGMEPPKPGFRSFQGPVCNHFETQKRAKSTLIHTSCRECFFVFVKDVVTTIAFT